MVSGVKPPLWARVVPGGRRLAASLAQRPSKRRAEAAAEAEFEKL